MPPRLALAIITLLLTLPACKPTTPESRNQPAPPPTTTEPETKPTPSIKEAKSPAKPKIIIDSQLTLSQALSGSKAPKDIQNQQTLLTITYLGFDGLTHQGQLLIHKDLADEVTQIFHELYQANYPIEKMIPISEYNWNDEASMMDNNTSAFNYRRVPGSKILSHHSKGRAIDINPYQNPYIDRKGNALTPHQKDHPAAITHDSVAVKIFKKFGWTWGGGWTSVKDFQHFEKP